MTETTNIDLTVNGATSSVTCDEAMPLLWVLRDLLDLSGTKYGCGAGFCGVCTVHLDGVAVRSCQIPISACQGRAVVTIEGLSIDGDHPVQRAWIDKNVPQCGYCQPGQVMAAASLLANNPRPTPEQVDRHMAGILCRCGTYPRIRQAIALASRRMVEP